MKPGMYWGRDKAGKWDLVDVRDASYRPDGWPGFEKGQPKIEIYQMGWDCPVPYSAFDMFVEANILDPDGNKWS